MAEMLSTRQTDFRMLALLMLPFLSHPMFGDASEARSGGRILTLK